MKLNTILVIILIIGLGFIVIMLSFLSRDFEDSSYYTSLIESLSDIENRYLREYAKFKQSPELSVVDFSNPSIMRKVAHLQEELKHLYVRRHVVNRTINFKTNVLYGGLVLYTVLFFLSFIFLRNRK